MNKRLFKILAGFLGMILVGLTSLYFVEYFSEDKSQNVIAESK